MKNYFHKPKHALQKPSSRSAEAGFTLLEIMLSMGILASMSVFAITAISNQLEIRNKLAGTNESQHGLNSAMSHVFEDVRHAYVLSKADSVAANVSSRPVKPGFVGKNETLYFSAQNFNSLAANSPESNLAMVRYYIREDAKDPSKKMLVRVVDTTFKESIERAGVGDEQVLLRDLKDFKVTYWNGQDWAQEWDTNSGDTSGKMPKMVKIKITVNSPLTEDQKQKRELDPNATKEVPTISLESIAYLLYSAGQKDVKEPSKEFKWQ